MSYHSVLRGEMPSPLAAATALTASARPWARALPYFPLAPGRGLIVSSLPYRGNRVLQEA
jgi:hypothetical protein